MEGQTQFQTALKKTVVMFKTLTGKELTEEEGSIFINLLDMTEGYLTNGKREELFTKELVQVAQDVAEGRVEVTPYVRRTERDNDSSCNAVGGEPGQNKSAQAGLDGYADYEYIAKPITTSERDHIQGYDWQIVVLSREKDPRDSYVVHFAYQPTQEQFEEHFAKFVARTLYVHVNEWDRLHDEWVGVTSHYTNTHRLGKDHDPRWEQDDMAYRVRYYDRETGQLTFKYMPRKPSGNEQATYHHLKGFAVVQSKVA